MSTSIIFTRYLYIKDEVILSLIKSILDRKSEESLFWAYELYYSGFKMETLDLIVKIYYLFFASLNPSFEKYLLKKYKEELHPKIIATLIRNLIIRPFNLDIFLAIYTENMFDIEMDLIENCDLNSIQDLKNQIGHWIKEEDLQSISHFIITDYTKYKSDLIDIYRVVIDIFNNIYPELQLSSKGLIQELNTTKSFNFNKNYIVLSKIFHIFYLKKKLSIGKNLFVKINDTDLIKYETVTKTTLGPYMILKESCIYGIEDNELILNMFKLKRIQVENKLVKAFNEDWLYYASCSPIWLERIKESNGKIEVDTKQITFDNIDNEEEFYNKYNYEPDEQCIDIKKKCIPELNLNNSKINYWKEFYTKYNNSSLIKLYDDDLNELVNKKIEFI